MKSIDVVVEDDEVEDDEGARRPLRVMDVRYEVCAFMRVSRVADGYFESAI